MKKATLKDTFAEFRAEKRMTFALIANKCDLDETTVLKVETGKSVRWETLHLILAVGMGTRPGTAKYEEFHRLWLAQRQELAESSPPDKNAKKLSVHAAAAVFEFRSLIRDLDKAQTAAVMLAVRRSVQQSELDRILLYLRQRKASGQIQATALSAASGTPLKKSRSRLPGGGLSRTGQSRSSRLGPPR